MKPRKPPGVKVFADPGGEIVKANKYNFSLFLKFPYNPVPMFAFFCFDLSRG